MISLTSVGFDFRQMGEVAGQMLLHQMQRKPGAPLHRRLRGELIVRHSTGPAPRRAGVGPNALTSLGGS